jgi:hypothetical protein
MPGPFVNFLLSTRDDCETFRRCASEHIASLCGYISTILADACAYMSQVATYRICISQALHLRLVFKPGTPVLKSFKLFSSLPYHHRVRGLFRTRFPDSGDEVHIIAALKRPDRVRSISLTVTTSLLEKLYAIERPFLDLKDLILLSRYSAPLTLPSSFQWGPRLRRLHLTRVAIPALLQLLYSSTNLVDLQLHEALNHPSIEALTGALSGMAQLGYFHSISPLPPMTFPHPHYPIDALFSLL